MRSGDTEITRAAGRLMFSRLPDGIDGSGTKGRNPGHHNARPTRPLSDGSGGGGEGIGPYS